MVQFLAGLKGEGKTRKLVDLANANAKTSDGHVVFIDDDKRRIHDIERDIRFVEAEKGLLSNYRELIGFVLGILSQNNDITDIYVDGLNNIVCSLCDSEPNGEELLKLQKRLEELSVKENVNFRISLHCAADALPEAIKAVLI